MDATADLERRAQRDVRECECPEWVERCVHFGGHWLAFHIAPGDSGDWAVCTGKEPPTYLSYSSGHTAGVRTELYTEADAALEAFHAAEARLLARDEVAP